MIGSRPTRRQYYCKDCQAKLEVERFSYLFRLVEVIMVSGLSVYFSFFYSTIRQAAKQAGHLQSSMVFIVLLLIVLLPVDYLVWRTVVKFKKAK